MKKILKFVHCEKANMINPDFYFPKATLRSIVNFYIQIQEFSPELGDTFFETFGPGTFAEVIDRPYERFHDYEKLLKIIYRTDKEKYALIHKGTPYYFMAWLSFLMKQYEKAVFYMDAAISEDIRREVNKYKLANPSDLRSDEDLAKGLLPTWIGTPAGHFFQLQEAGNQSAVTITRNLRNKVISEIERFNTATSSSITIENLISKFILKLAEKRSSRSIITAFYSFILEFEDIQAFILLRSKDGGSIEPVLTYLFKGGLIFESLLKELFPEKDGGTPIKTLGELRQNSSFTSTYVSSISTSATTLGDIVTSIGSQDLQTAFDTTAKIRNTAGHNLQWDDVFNDLRNFNNIYYQIINAYLFICQKSFDV